VEDISEFWFEEGGTCDGCNKTANVFIGGGPASHGVVVIFCIECDPRAFVHEGLTATSTKEDVELANHARNIRLEDEEQKRLDENYDAKCEWFESLTSEEQRSVIAKEHGYVPQG